ncbi:Periplasmic binding protein domain containing protein [Actinobacteria bacterium OK074]|nr:Periplasmic binding protein domain containing protein [Actinobacteria bacterium OK074]
MPLSARSRRAAMAVSAGLVLCGCGSQSGSGSSSGPLALGFVNGAETEFHTCLQKTIAEQARDNGFRLYTANSHQNPASELHNIEGMIARHVDAIIVQTVNTTALTDDIAKAKAAGIPIFLTSVDTGDRGDILGAVVVPLKRVGQLDADWVARDADGRRTEVGVIAGAPGAASDLLTSGFTKRLPKNVSVVANLPGMFDPAKAKAVAKLMIQAHPEMEYAFVANEEMAFAAREAFDANGGRHVKIATVNGTDEGLAAIKDGRFAATVTNSADSMGELAVNNTVDLLLKDKKVDKIDQLPIRLITKDNTALAPLYCPPDA